MRLKQTVGRWVNTVPRPGRDGVVAALFVALDVVLFSDLVHNSGATPSTQMVQATGAVLCFGVLIASRRFPLGALVIICGLSAGLSLYANFRVVFAVCLALGTATSRVGGLGPGAGLFLSFLTAMTWVASEIRSSPEVDSLGDAVTVGVGYALFLLVAGGIGRWSRTGRERLRLLDERRRAEAKEALAAERLRLARELHDIVSHAVTLMVLHAAGARRVLPTDPARADEALATVEEAGGRAMSELRRLLGVLRVSAEDDGAEAASTLRGLNELPELLAAMRKAGLEIDFREEGARKELDASVDLAAYRVVQEALTNVSKHAGPGAHVVIKLAWKGDSLEIEVRDDGTGAGKPAGGLSTGHGILGLRERISVAGGELLALPVEEGGFRVRAVLPLAGGPEARDEAAFSGLPQS